MKDDKGHVVQPVKEVKTGFLAGYWVFWCPQCKTNVAARQG